MDKYHFREIFSILKKEVKGYQAPVVELYAQNRHVFHVLISCVLSLRTNDKVTSKVCGELFRQVDKPQDIVKLGLPRLRSLIKRVNFYKTKAKNIMIICEILVDKYRSQVPSTPEELLALPNVGRKTMGIVMQYGHRVEGDYIPTDTHVHICANRLGWVKTKKPEETEKELMKIVPREYWLNLNTILVTFGQEICTSTSPFCSQCPIYKYCPKIGVIRNR
ncbi:MAG TPA: endonuclease III [Candidatus Nanoarchaeia archaeon]|nr:endonuclease III [Candidatus Nanoarchaeia archaeon]